MTTMTRPDVTASADDLTLQDLERGDAAVVRAVFAGLGPRSRALRFLSPKPRLTEEDVRRLVAVDGRDHAAIVASSVDGPVGIGRLIRDRSVPAAAEISLAVVDEWHGRGVGTRLLGELVRRARAVGVRRLTVVVSTDNAAVLRLLERFPGEVSPVRTERGVAEYVVALDG